MVQSAPGVQHVTVNLRYVLYHGPSTHFQVVMVYKVNRNQINVKFVLQKVL